MNCDHITMRGAGGKRKQAEPLIPSRHIKLLLTNRCNARCFYCHMEGQDRTGKVEERIDGVFVERLLRHVACEHLSISGGEPTIHPKVEEICRAAAQGGVRAILDTNGHLHETVRSVLPYLSEIRFNLDTPFSERYREIKGFDSGGLLRSIMAAREAGVPVALNVTALPENTDGESFWRLHGFAKEIGASLRFIEQFDGNPKERGCSNIERLYPALGWSPPLGGMQSDSGMRLRDGVCTTVLHGVRITVFRTICAAAMEGVAKGFNSELLEFRERGEAAPECRSGMAGTPSPQVAADFCRAYSKLYINPAGDIKPCFVSDATVPFHDAVMSEDTGAIADAIGKAVAGLGRGPCAQKAPGERSGELILARWLWMQREAGGSGGCTQAGGKMPRKLF